MEKTTRRELRKWKKRRQKGKAHSKERPEKRKTKKVEREERKDKTRVMAKEEDI